ncbi:MAG TPA: FeoB-associated Cys-rich membrane protein [Pirellulaceae bacterium]|nr:FeoB-associated Cys-rich membrane protein [Pirellulaceae bacterium]
MNTFWQNLIALTIVAGAAGFLGREGWRWLFKKQASGCGSACSGCGTTKQIVSLDLTYPAAPATPDSHK